MTTYLGKITLYNELKGWGFITRDDGEQFFFHVSNKVRNFLPALGARVQFELAAPITLGKKEQAVHVRDDYSGGAQ
jgi:cold shock CspA family protein